MIVRVFAVYDSKASAFMSPMSFATQPLAIRAFSEAANDPTHQICKHAGDFTLYEIGMFDDVTGEVTGLSQHINLGMATSYKTIDIPPNLADFVNFKKGSAQ